MNGYDRIFILGLDGLEYHFVEKWNLMHLKQRKYDKIKVPIDKEGKIPKTPEVWAAFLTGERLAGIYFVKPLQIAIPLKILSLIRKHFKISLGLGKTISSKASVRLPKLKQKTFLDLTKSKEINAPYYGYDGAAFNIIKEFDSEKLTLNDVVDALRALYRRRKRQILYEAEQLQDVDLIFAYMHFPDVLQHLLFTRAYQIRKLYVDLDNYVSALKERLGNSLFLIVSDHGFDLRTKTHSKHGFYSSNITLKPKPKRITDFYNMILQELRNEYEK